MTVLGKMLVILNLVFTLVVAGLLVVVYARRTNWQDAYKKMESRYSAARSAADANAETSRKAQDNAKTFEGDVEKRLREEEKVRKDLEAKLVKATDDLRKTNTLLSDRDREVRQLRDDVSRTQKERDVMETALKQRDDQNRQLLGDYNKVSNESTSYKLQADSLRVRNVELQARVKALEDTIKQKGTAVVSGSTGKKPANPPPVNVEGLVKQVDESSQLLVISIGSDSGIQKDHTLDAYRYGETVKYLGTIRIVEVRAKEAVARPEGMVGQVKAGDRVGHGGF